MSNLKLKFLSLSILFFLTFATNLQVANATTYPYSVSIGDKFDYHVDTLINGSSTGPINIFGLNMSQGDNFQMEVFTGKANPSSYVGSEFTVKFVIGSNKSTEINGQTLLYTSNATFWNSYTNTSQDIGGQVYQLSHSGSLITYSWTQNADNFNKISFNTTDGIVTSYERATTSGLYNYTHFKFTRGSSGGGLLGDIPGFDFGSGVLALFSIGTIVHLLKKNKK